MINELKKHPYINPNISIEKHDSPFKYYVLRDVFNENIYKSIVKNCILSTANTPVYADTAGATSNYRGRLQNISSESIGLGSDFFVSDTWKNFNMKMFNLMLTEYIALSFHVHDAPAQKGFTHTDFNICSFSEKPDNKDYQLIDVVNYASDKDDHFIKMMRSAAFLYYFNNHSDSINTGDGGTDIFDHNKKLCSTVNATNNSLLCFEVTPESYHSFAGSTYQRSALVGWLHSTPVKAIHRNIDLVKKLYKQNGIFSEKWPNSSTYWNIQNDPEFYEVFGDKTKELLKEFNIPSQTTENISKKRILVIGGTRMIGRDFVEYSMQNQKNYEIYIANRNITNPNLFTCNHIKIDRNSPEQCKSLADYGEFDIIVDFSCYNSRQLYNVLLNTKYKKYYIISTTATTQDFVLKDKSNPMYNYANDKLALENYINSTTLKDRICIVRPCIVYGEHDYSNRFYKNGDNFYYKDTKKIVHNDINHIYVRDFTKKLLKNIEYNTQGTITITGRPESLSTAPASQG